MNRTQALLNGFEQRLLTVLKDEIREREVTTQRSTPGNHRTALILAGSAAAVGAITTVAVPMLAGKHAAPAFAVDISGDHTVTASIFRFHDAAGLQAQLADASVTAIVQYAPPGKTCKRPSYTHLEGTLPRGALSIGLNAGDHFNETSVTVSPSALRGHTLVLTLIKSYGGAVTPSMRSYASSVAKSQEVDLSPATIRYLDVGVTNDAVAPCTIADDPSTPGRSPR